MPGVSHRLAHVPYAVVTDGVCRWCYLEYACRRGWRCHVGMVGRLGGCRRLDGSGVGGKPRCGNLRHGYRSRSRDL